MSAMTNKKKIRNVYIKVSIGVASIIEKTRENRLRYLGHVLRREGTEE